MALVTRKLDKLGRIGMPTKWIRKDPNNRHVEMFIKKGRIVIRRFYKKDIKEREYIGLVRQYDEQGRVSIPAEMLQTLQIPLPTNVIMMIRDDEIQIIPENEMEDFA